MFVMEDHHKVRLGGKMDFNKIIKRVIELITKPVETMQTIKNELATVKDLYLGYALVLAAVPALAGFLGFLIAGMPFGLCITIAISYYIAFLLSSVLFGILIDAIAPQFGAQKDMVASFKVSVYSFTAVWVASAIFILPDLRVIFFIASLYGIYLCYLGLTHIKDTPKDKLIPYLVICAVAAVILIYLSQDLVFRIALRSYFKMQMGSLGL